MEYSDCWQGSQLKQNIRSLSSFLRAKRDHRSLAFDITPSDWDRVNEIYDWVNSPAPSNPVVLHVRRDVDVFGEDDVCLPLGPEKKFVERVMAKIVLSDEVDRIAIRSVLQDDR